MTTATATSFELLRDPMTQFLCRVGANFVIFREPALDFRQAAVTSSLSQKTEMPSPVRIQSN